MPEIKWLPDAIDDLDGLFRFLNDRSPQAANRAAAAIRRGAGLLDTMPELGRPMADGTGRRELVIPFGAAGYVLRYRLDDNGAVVVIRVWHGREDRQAVP